MQLQLGFYEGSIRFCVLGSGSSGNATVIESGSHRVLVDAGFSCREIERRLDAVGMSSREFSAIVLTHEHGDHARGAARFSRRHRVPIHATRGTLAGLRLPKNVPEPVVLKAEKPVEISGFRVEPFAVPHDAREPIGLVIESDGRRVGLAADLGMPEGVAWDRLHGLDALILETNHDPEMLQNGPYPWPLKKRIAGHEGHLSNLDAARSLPRLLSKRLQWVVLYHLSTTNNCPLLAEKAIGSVLARSGARAEICVAEQARPTPWMSLARAEAAA